MSTDNERVLLRIANILVLFTCSTVLGMCGFHMAFITYVLLWFLNPFIFVFMKLWLSDCVNKEDVFRSGFAEDCPLVFGDKTVTRKITTWGRFFDSESIEADRFGVTMGTFLMMALLMTCL